MTLSSTIVLFFVQWIGLFVFSWYFWKIPLDELLGPAFATAVVSQLLTSLFITARAFLPSENKVAFDSARRWWIFTVLCTALVGAFVPGYMESLGKKRNSVVKANMISIKRFVDAFAKDHQGSYPTGIDELKPYFPGGSPKNGSSGDPLINPYTHRPEWPVLGTVKDVLSARKAAPTKLGEGVIEYSPIGDGAGKITDYALRGGGYEGRALGPRYLNVPEDGTLVLSREHISGR